MTEKMVQDAEALFTAHDSEGTQLLSRGALTELLRQVGLEQRMGDAFTATARLAFDAHSADSHFLSLAEFKQLYYVVNQRYPALLPRKPFLRIHVYSASGLPPADFNGKSDPFVVLQLSGKPQSKSQTTVIEKTLDPVWGKAEGKAATGEEFYDKYVYEEGDNLEFVVHDYDKGCTDYEVLGKGKLSSEQFHKQGGFHGDIQLKCPPELGKAFVEKPPTLRIKVVVNELEKEEPPPGIGQVTRAQQRHPSLNVNGAAKFKVAASLITSAEKAMHSMDKHWSEHHPGPGEHGEGTAVPAAA
jgi:hypothetical protein